jgi:hypothetical protein
MYQKLHVMLPHAAGREYAQMMEFAFVTMVSIQMIAQVNF